MDQPDLNRRFGFLLHDVSRLWRRRFDYRSVELGLTRAQWTVLAHLYRGQGVNQATLADRLDVTQITLARLVDRLEGAGWVERRPHPDDRRAKCLYLTPKAEAQVEHMRALADEVQNEALAGLGDQQQDLLIEMLLRVKDNLLAAECAKRTSTHRASDPLVFE